MDKKAHEALECIRKDVTLMTSDLENEDAAEFSTSWPTGRMPTVKPC